MSSILIFILGVIFGAAVVFIIGHLIKKKTESEASRVKEEMEKAFKAASYDLSKQSIEEILKVSKELLESKTSESAADLEAKKKLIDQSLGSLARDMQERLEKVQKLMTDINQAVPEKYGQISRSMEQIAKQSEDLRLTTESLNRALSSTQVRGQ